MKLSKFENFAKLQGLRELDVRYAEVLQKKYMTSPGFIKRLGLYGELDGHTGCVNCLEWSEDGKILASGSDDVHVCLWDPFKKKQLTSIATGHHGNVFTVKFLPNSGNRTLVTGAADNSVRIHDTVAKDIIGICTCHTNRVKRCVADSVSPNLFWSAGEDGVIIQHDLRTAHTCPTSDVKKNRNVLIDLRKYIGGKAEAKCLAINPVRTDHIAVGANDPFVRIYDRRMIKIVDAEGPSLEWKIGAGAVQYFVPGHLPSKITEYKKRYRSLAATYLTFSPDGTELLVNLGGEQIYLFPVVGVAKMDTKCFSTTSSSTCSDVEYDDTTEQSNGYKNGTEIFNPVPGDFKIFSGMRPMNKPKEKVILPESVDAIKGKGNEAFKAGKYATAVNFYNEALKLCPQSPILFGNRAAALLKRRWRGDFYAALRDCHVAIFLDPEHFKALLSLSRCLFELNRFSAASACLIQFKHRFPHLKGVISKSFEEDLSRALTAEANAAAQLALKNAEKKANVSKVDSPSTSSSNSPGSQNTAATFFRRSGDYFLRFRRTPGDGDGLHVDDSSNVDEDDDSSADNELLFVTDSNPTQSSDSNSSSPVVEANAPKTNGSKKPDFYTHEVLLRNKAIDFSERYCGHCNTTTDIKEANFFGGYIVAGSDDGSFFIWDRKTTNIVKIIKGDESIVNCLQPHPSTCMLATSGIESVVRLWTPMPEEGFVNDRVVKDVNEAAYENQKRMKSNPFEVILMNMGYRISGAED